MSTIQVFEHEKITIHNDEFGRSITSNQLEKLCQFNDNNDNKYYTIIRNGVKFSQYVGVIQIGNLTIEILPKADKKKIENQHALDNTTATWRKVLLKMLSVCGEVKVDAVSEASLRRRNNSLLDLYFEIFIKEVDLLIRKGLVRKYRSNSGNVKSLKGRLNFSKNIQKNLIHKERFYTHHQCYDYEHLLNQILLKGLNILSTISYNPVLLDRIDKLRFGFPEIEEIPINRNSFDKIILERRTEGYIETVKIAKMLTLNYSPDISKGRENMLALLFDMNNLWEKYIFKMMKKGENNIFSVRYQQKQDFWNNRGVKPDIVMERKGETYIIDTKWKIISPDKPSDDDLKQMYVYNMYWDAPKSMLLYPKNDNKEDGKYGTFHKGREIDKENKCKVGFVNVLNQDYELNKNIVSDILEKIDG